MDQPSSLKKDILLAIGILVIAIGFEIGLCIAVIDFAFPVNLARFVVWILWFAMAFLAWVRYAIGGESTALTQREYVIYFALVGCYAVVAFSIIHFAFQTFHQASGAMEPAILIGDRILVKKFNIQIHRGDIVSFEAPPASAFNPDGKYTKSFVKRVVAVAGDEIKIQNKQLILNGESLWEPYAVHSDSMTYQGNVPVMTQNYQSAWESGSFTRLEGQRVRDNFGPIRVPTASYFILGDSRDASFDSRFCGPLSEKLVTGKAIRIYSPSERARRL